MCVPSSCRVPLVVTTPPASWGPVLPLPAVAGDKSAVLALRSLCGVRTLFIPALAKTDTIMISHGN